ncbi:MAG: hypothetical protein H6672_20135 [Anaerolineaceae bacterium]|nr:hypothetical protein [Anaerolineaceae bacterium]
MVTRSFLASIGLFVILMGILTACDGGTEQTPTVTPPPVMTDTPTPPPLVVDEFDLGGQIFSFTHLNLMKSAGMTWFKQQVVYDQGDSPSSVRSTILAAHGNGFKVLLSIKGNKEQLAADPTHYYQDFANFLGRVAALGPDGIEVWNEQNIDREWPVGQIGGDAYTQMLTAAYNAIKDANPNVMVISGAPAPTGFFAGCSADGCDDAPFLQQMAEAGAAQFMDCVGIHYNEGILSPTQSSGDPRGNSSHYTRYYSSMVNTYTAIFPSKPLCFTELGYLSSEGYGRVPPGFEWAADTTVENQAIWLAEAATLSKDSGRVRLMIVWNVDATEYGADPQAGYAIIRPGNICNACETLGAVMNGN